MRRATLIRDESTSHGTRGALVAGARRWCVMEPPDRGNRPNRSCIPPGRYEVRPHHSPRFGRCLLVAGVPGRTHILIHTGNVGGDVEIGLHTHTLGCLLPGIQRGRIEVRGRVQRAVLGSRTAFRQIMGWAAGAGFELEIAHV